MTKGVLLSCAITILLIVLGIFALVFKFHIPSITIPGLNQSKSANTFNPQTTQLFLIGQDNEAPITILGHILPQFALSLAEKDFSNLWIAHAQERDDMVTTDVVNAKGDETLKVTTQFDDTKKQLVVTPVVENSVKPGMYTLTVKVKTVQGKDITITQDFAWGVLAINTNKAIYKPGDTVNIGMTVLDDIGATKCIAKDGVIVFGTAKLALTVTSPSGKTLTMSTDDGTIKGSPSCKDRSYSNDADFLTKLTNLNAIGKYKLHMEAETVFGKRSIDSFFNVQATPPAFDIERTKYPTRIYPRYDYPVTVAITANQDYSGSVYDIVPASLTISKISDGGTTENVGNYQKIKWNVHLHQGQTYYLFYTIHFPRVSPEFYLVGPLTIGSFTEGNEWQIASDSLFSFIQEAHNVATSGTTVTVTMGQPVALNDLLVMNCSKFTSTRASTTYSSTGNTGWTRSYASGPSGERYAQFFRVVNAATAGATSFTCINAGGSSGETSAEIMEFTGNATASPKDKSVVRTSTVQCTTTADILPTFTSLTNPDELVVTQFLSTKAGIAPTGSPNHTQLAGANSSGFTDNVTLGLNGFNGTTGSYDSSWAEAATPDTNPRDTVIWSGSSSNTCVNAATAYNPTISISQGAYWFYNNQNSLTPGSQLTGSQNTTLSLTTIGQAFRLRLLLDVDSTGGTQIGLQTLDMILQFAPLPSSGQCSSIADVDWTPVATVSADIKTDIAWNQNDFIATSGAVIAGIPIVPNNDPVDAGYGLQFQSYYQDDFSSNGPADNSNPGSISNDQSSIANNQAGEWDFSLVDNTGGAGEGTYCLELAQSNGSPLSAYRQYPQVSFAKAGVVIKGGTLIKGSGNPGGVGTNCIGANQLAASCGTKIK